MMENTKRKMQLHSIDDLFTTQEERDEVNLEKVLNISLNEIDDFPNHPFKVLENEELKDLMESIKEKGVLSPALVRKKADGRYEMVSGHRRKKASELLSLESLPCIVRNLTDDEATIIMVDSNLQREKILPSEKAFAYKIKLEAIKHQGSRTDLTSVKFAQKFDYKSSRQVVAEQVGESEEKIRRYIRLTELIPKILEMVDNEIIKISPAVEISYLSKEAQQQLLDQMECYDCTPSHHQAIELKKLSERNELTVEKMEEIMSESKPNQTPKLKVSMNRLNNILPRTLRNDREREEYVIKAVEFYDKYQKKIRERKEQER